MKVKDKTQGFVREWYNDVFKNKKIPLFFFGIIFAMLILIKLIRPDISVLSLFFLFLIALFIGLIYYLPMRYIWTSYKKYNNPPKKRNIGTNVFLLYALILFFIFYKYYNINGSFLNFPWLKLLIVTIFLIIGFYITLGIYKNKKLNKKR